MSPDFWLLVDVRHLSPPGCALSLAGLLPWVEGGCAAGRAGDPDFLGFQLWLVDLQSGGLGSCWDPQLPGLAHNGRSMVAHGLKPDLWSELVLVRVLALPLVCYV